ncbi:MAG: TetR/AcrR family transcriptional regulator [Pseudomonadales bacterium]
MTKQTKPTYHHGDLRQSLLSGAAEIIRTEGSDALSMRKLADKVGVSRTAPYHHFIDKHALLCALGEEGFRQHLAVFSEAGSDQGVDLERDIRLYVSRYVDYATAHPEYYDLMFGREIWKSGEVTDSLKQCAGEAFRLYKEQMADWIIAAGHNDDIPPRVEQATWGALHGISRLLIDGIYTDEEAKKEICDACATMIINSLK